MADKKNLFWDMDGTIVHSGPMYPDIITAFCDYKQLPCDIEKIAHGYTQPLVHDMGWGIPLKDQPAMYREFEYYHVDQMKNHQNFIPALYENMETIIPELAKEYNLSIITLNTRIIAEAFLEQHGLLQYFPNRRTLCCAQERNYGLKPAADTIHCLINETKQELCNSIMIGDSSVDIQMAHAAGIPGIAVLWGLSSTEKVMAANPTIALSKPDQLPQAIKNIFNR